MNDVFASPRTGEDALDVRRQLALEDTDLVTAFDRLCRLAAGMVHVPIAVVTIFDGERQIIRGGVGNLETLGITCDIPFSRTFCQHLLPTGEPLVVNNVRAHPEMQSYVVVNDHGVVAYLGLPLATSDGNVLGSFCLMDLEPRTWTPRDMEQLRDLTASVITEIDLRYQLHVQQRLERALNERDAFVQRILEQYPDGSINVFDTNLRYLFVAGMGLEQVGLSAEYLLGKRLVDVFPASEVDAVLPHYRQVLDGATVEFELTVGEWTFSVNASPLHDADGAISTMLVVAHNITERKRIEFALRESEARFRTAYDNASSGIALADLDGRYQHANPAFCKMFGYTEDEVRGMTYEQLAHPDDREATTNYANGLLAGTITNEQLEKRYLHKSGAIVWTILSISMLHDPWGNPSCFMSQVQNITTRKLAEQALQESEQRFRIVFEHSPDSIILFDPHDPSGMLTIVDANPEACRMNGYELEELIGMPILRLLAAPIDRETFIKTLPTHIEGIRAAGTVRAEDIHRRKDGTFFPIEYATSLVTVNGRELLLGIDRDITQRKQAEAALFASETRFRTAFDSSYGGMVLLAADGVFQDVNAGFCRMLGYTREEMLVMTIPELTHPDDLHISVEVSQQLLAGTTAHAQYEKRFLHRSGTVVWALLSTALLRDAAGNPLSLIAHMQDITERKAAEEALHVSEERFQLVARATNDAIWDWDIEAQTLWWNESYAEVFGLQAGMHHKGLMAWSRYIHPQDRHRITQGLQTALNGTAETWSDEYRYRCGDGSYSLVIDRGIIVRDQERPVRMIGSMMNVTVRKQMEESLRASEARFRTIFEHAPIGIINLDAAGRLIAINRTFEGLVGRNADTMLETSVVNLIHPDDVAMVVSRYRELLAHEHTPTLMELRCMHAGGYELWVQVTASAVRASDDTFMYAILMVEDITEQRRVEAALRESEERFRSANEYAAIGMALVGRDGRFIQVNPALCGIFGYDPDVLLGMSFADISHPDDHQVSIAAIQRLLARDTPYYQFEKRYLNAAGKTIWAVINISLMFNPGGEPLYYIVQIQDITERKWAEQELALARRRLGESRELERLHLARELHDGAVQQLLGISYQLAASPQRVTQEKTVSNGMPTEHHFDSTAIRQHVLGVVSQLRGLTRELRPAGLEEFGLSAALENYIVQLRTEYAGKLPQIVTNLTPNDARLSPAIAVCMFRVAQEAIRNALAHANAESLTLTLSLDEHVVELTIQDDGVGFALPGRLSQLVYDDHFGLVGMLERVEAVDGKLEIDTQPGIGTTLRIRVPHDVRATMREA